MAQPIPVTLDDISPTEGKADVLWDILPWLLIMVADRGSAVRYVADSAFRRMEYLYQGRWQEMMEPRSTPWQLRNGIYELLKYRQSGQRPLFGGRVDLTPRTFTLSRPVRFGIGPYSVTLLCKVTAGEVGVDILFRETEGFDNAIVEAAMGLVTDFYDRFPWTQMSDQRFFDADAN